MKLDESILATNKKEETFYITKDNDDDSKEVVCRLKCDMEQAVSVFKYLVNEQAIEFRKPNNTQKWRTIRLFDSKTRQQICQES